MRQTIPFDYSHQTSIHFFDVFVVLGHACKSIEHITEQEHKVVGQSLQIANADQVRVTKLVLQLAKHVNNGFFVVLTIVMEISEMSTHFRLVDLIMDLLLPKLALFL